MQLDAERRDKKVKKLKEELRKEESACRKLLTDVSDLSDSNKSLRESIKPLEDKINGMQYEIDKRDRKIAMLERGGVDRDQQQIKKWILQIAFDGDQAKLDEKCDEILSSRNGSPSEMFWNCLFRSIRCFGARFSAFLVKHGKKGKAVSLRDLKKSASSSLMAYRDFDVVVCIFELMGLKCYPSNVWDYFEHWIHCRGFHVEFANSKKVVRVKEKERKKIDRALDKVFGKLRTNAESHVHVIVNARDCVDAQI